MIKESKRNHIFLRGKCHRREMECQDHEMKTLSRESREFYINSHY